MSRFHFYLALAALALLVGGCIENHPDSVTKQELATERNDPSICKKASNPDVCLTGVGRANNNPEACAMIKDDSWKQTCYASITDDDQNTVENEEPSGCRYDSECDPLCEGNTLWKQGCNPRTGQCEKTFDTDCTATTETFAGFTFPKTCDAGQCIRDQEAIDQTKAELQLLQSQISQNVKALNAYRDDVNTQKLQANKNCLNALADVTNKFIIDSALKIGSILASGAEYVKSGSSIITQASQLDTVDDELAVITTTSYEFTAKFTQDAAGYFGDYADKIAQTMYDLNNAQQKPPVEDYIAFWCDYNNYLGEVLDATGEQLDQQVALAKALAADQAALP